MAGSWHISENNGENDENHQYQLKAESNGENGAQNINGENVASATNEKASMKTWRH
jgi:hypothetical protein